jgi:hypothetical protein
LEQGRARIFERKRDGIVGDWRWLRNEERHGLNFSPNNIQMIKAEEYGINTASIT